MMSVMSVKLQLTDYCVGSHRMHVQRVHSEVIGVHVQVLKHLLQGDLLSILLQDIAVGLSLTGGLDELQKVLLVHAGRCVDVGVHLCVFTSVYMCVYVSVSIWVCVWVFVLFIYMSFVLSSCLCVCVCVCVCLSVCVICVCVIIS